MSALSLCRWILPFSGVLDWSKFSGALALDEIEKLPAYARSLDYSALQFGVQQARLAMRYRLDAYQGDGMLPLLVFEMWRRMRAMVPGTDHVKPIGGTTVRGGLQVERSFEYRRDLGNNSFAMSRYVCRSAGRMCECESTHAISGSRVVDHVTLTQEVERADARCSRCRQPRTGHLCQYGMQKANILPAGFATSNVSSPFHLTSQCTAAGEVV